MVRDIIVIGSMATFVTIVFSFILGVSVVLLPVPFLALVIPLCLAGQLVVGMKLDEIAEWLGYKFKG